MSSLQEKFNNALKLFQAGEHNAVTADINKLLVSSPENADILHLAALNEKAKWNYPEAQALFRDSLRCSPKQPIVLSNLANLLKAMGDFVEADKLYVAAIQAMPSLRDAWLNRGLLAKDMRDWQQAKTCIAEALRLKRDPTVFVILLEIYLVRNELEILNSESIIFQNENPSLVEGYVYQARGLTKQGDLLTARKILIDSMSKVDNKARIELELGLHHYECDDLIKAKFYLESAVDTTPDYIDAHRSLNELYFQSGSEKFLKSYANAIDKSPSSEILLHNLAATQASSGDIDKAIDTLKSAIARLGSSAFLDHGLGALLVRKRLLDDAVPLFERALNGNPTNLRFILDRISLAIKMGQQDLCQPLISRALTIQPYNQETWAYQGMIWRLGSNDRYHWLYNYDAFLKSYSLPAPNGYSNVQDFMKELDQYLSTLHISTRQPLDQSVVKGTQTMGVLLEDPNPLVVAFKSSLMECVDHYIKSLEPEAKHPFVGRLADGYDFSGSWSVKLKKTGHHSNHVHPFGWLSCCSYISVPDLSKSKSGWIKFGETSLNAGQKDVVEQSIMPEIGKCVFFPSYFWHGTYPLESHSVRTTIPCDIDPVKYLQSS